MPRCSEGLAGIRDDSVETDESGDAFGGVRGSLRSLRSSSSWLMSGSSTRCVNSMESTGSESWDRAVGMWGAGTLRSTLLERLRPREGREGPAELEGLELDGELLPGPKERRFRKERKEERPPGEPEGLVLVGGCVGLPLTARYLVGGAKPRYGVDKELGSELWDGRGICDCIVFVLVSTAISRSGNVLNCNARVGQNAHSIKLDNIALALGRQRGS